MTNKERAMLVAERAHRNQDYDIYPYIYHIRLVVEIAEELGFDETIIIACTLHDVQENYDMSYNDIKKAFGVEVAEIVFAVTDELGRNRTERHQKTYPKIRANWKAVAVKICDRIANVKQSREYTPNKIKMYREEQHEFYNGIYNPEHPESELRKAWDMLDNLIR